MEFADYMVFLFLIAGLSTQIIAEFKLNNWLNENHSDFSFPSRVTKLRRRGSNEDRIVARNYVIRFFIGLVIVILGFSIIFMK